MHMCAFVDCVRECGSPVHLWIVCANVDLSRAFVDCVRECAFVGGFDTVFTP